ncbi:MAG: hypothetical protein ABFD16_30430, partial [Thermoguttaceae bacterium]
MITITRRLALSLRSVFRRAPGAGRGPGPAVCFAGGPEGLRVRARLGDVAVEYHAPGEITPETLWLPSSFLADCEGKKEEPVQLESLGEGRVMAQWRDGRVPQLVQYEAVEPPGTEAFPGLPEAFAENPPSLLAAMHDAAETVDPDSIRYVLVRRQVLIFGYSRFSFRRASSILNCQSTPRCLALVFSDQTPI